MRYELFDYFRCISPLPKQHRLFNNLLDAYFEIVGQLWSARAKIVKLERYIAILESEVREKYHT